MGIFGGTLFCLLTGEVLVASSGGESRDTAKHSTRHRIAPTAKNYLALNVNSAQAEKPCGGEWGKLVIFKPECVTRLDMYFREITLVSVGAMHQ